jgi:hypothetical protein
LIETLDARANVHGAMCRNHKRLSQQEHAKGLHEQAQMHTRIAQNHRVLQKLDRLVIADMLSLCAELGINVRFVQQKEIQHE